MSRTRYWKRWRQGRSHTMSRMRRFDRESMIDNYGEPRYMETLWGISRHPDKPALLHQGTKP